MHDLALHPAFRLAALVSLTLAPIATRAQLEPGSCQVGTAAATLNSNAGTGGLFNTGGLFFGTQAFAEYKVEDWPLVFAASVWVGGRVEGEVRVAAATYSSYEMWPGPLGDEGRPVDPDNCSTFDRIYTVDRAAVDAFEQQGNVSADLAAWPFQLGAPVLDGDGDPDNYDLAAGDRPDLGAGETAWFWVMNDVGNTHVSTGSAPLGVEVRVHVTAPSVGDDRLDRATLLRYEIVNKSPDVIQGLSSALFFDADVGSDFLNDLVGTDPERELVYTYNAANLDGRTEPFGTPLPTFDPPAFGVMLLSGEITGSAYFTNTGVAGETDPQTLAEFDCVLGGLSPQCAEYVAEDGGATPFAFAGDPLTLDGWTDRAANEPGDRRFTLSTKRRTLEPGEAQEMRVALVYAEGDHHLVAVEALKRAADAVRAWHEGDALPAPFAPEPLSPVALVAPADGETLTNPEPVLTWEAVAGANGYTVDLAATADFAQPIASHTTEETRWAPPLEDELLDRRLYWRVRAYGGRPAALSPPGQTRSFGIYRLGDQGFAAQGLGIAAVASATGEPCAVVDAACELGYGNGVFLDPDAGSDYFVAAERNERLESAAQELTVTAGITAPDNYEVRFSAACADPATPCFGLYAELLNASLGTSQVVRVPFEAWNVGGPLAESTPEPTRLIPLLRANGETAEGDAAFAESWADYFPVEAEVEGPVPLWVSVEAGAVYPVTDETYLFMPTVADGYDRFAAAAEASGGAGAAYEDTSEPDPSCSRNLAYADFCFRSESAGGTNNFVIGRLVFADYAGDGTTPDVGTVVRFNGDNALPPALDAEDGPDDAAGFALGAPYPNPASGQLAVPYVLSAGGDARLYVLDVLGREVAVVHAGPTRRGRRAASLEVGALAAGLYLVVLEGEGQRAVRRITVAR